MLRSPSEYTLEIPLPPDVDDQFRRWTERTPGATWPRWGGHITILNSFVPEQGLEPVVHKIETVCAAYRPFEIRFDGVVCGAHWLEPHLRTVLLVSSSREEGEYRTIMDLHRSLRADLASLARDLHPEISNRPYVPHLSLTAGLPEPEALNLMKAAQASSLRVRLTVEKVSLLEFVKEKDGERDARLVHSFALVDEPA